MSYPVTFEADYVEHRNRLTTFFRLILAIPVAIVLWFYEIVAFFAVIFAWFAIVITGRYPDGLYQFVAGVVRFLTRVTAYTALLCDPYPPFGGAPDASYPIRMDFAGPLPQYSRLKTGFRFILAIPVVVLRYVIGIAAGDRRDRGVVRDPDHRQAPPRPVRRDGAGQLLHGALGCLSVPADRDLPAVPGRADPRRRAGRVLSDDL